MWKLKVEEQELENLFNELAGTNFNTVKDVEDAISDTMKKIARAKKILRNTNYLKKIVSDTIIPMCNDIELGNEASDLLSKIEQKELDIKQFIMHEEGRLEWLNNELEKVREKEQLEKRKRLYKYMKENLM